MVEHSGRRAAFDKLTESQRVCLRLVRLGLTSKEIARETGLAHQTVDQYMSRAASALDLPNRHQAAEWLFAFEAEVVEESEFKSGSLATIDPPRPKELLPGEPEKVENETVQMAVGQPTAHPTEILKGLFQVPRVGGKRHNYTWAEKVIVITRIAVTALVGMSALLAIIKGAVFLLTP